MHKSCVSLVRSSHCSVSPIASCRLFQCPSAMCKCHDPVVVGVGRLSLRKNPQEELCGATVHTVCTYGLIKVINPQP